jgi:hypothetical protein
MGDGSFARFLERSFALLAAECPLAHARMCALLAPRRIRAQVDGEVVPVRFTREAPELEGDAGAAATVEVRASHRAILDLLDGKTTLIEAVEEGALFLRGAPADLAAFHDGFLAYVHGAVRAWSFPELLREYRARHQEPA